MESGHQHRLNQVAMDVFVSHDSMMLSVGCGIASSVVLPPLYRRDVVPGRRFHTVDEELAESADTSEFHRLIRLHLARGSLRRVYSETAGLLSTSLPGLRWPLYIHMSGPDVGEICAVQLPAEQSMGATELGPVDDEDSPAVEYCNPTQDSADGALNRRRHSRGLRTSPSFDHCSHQGSPWTINTAMRTDMREPPDVFVFAGIANPHHDLIHLAIRCARSTTVLWISPGTPPSILDDQCDLIHARMTCDDFARMAIRLLECR